jgi:hypothetical protein
LIQHPAHGPALTDKERATVRSATAPLNDLLARARERGAKLGVLVGKLFAAFNVFTGDEGKLRAPVMVWSEELEDLPLWAIRKAYKWAVRGSRNLPSLGEFIDDVKMAVGNEVFARRRKLQSL